MSARHPESFDYVIESDELVIAYSYADVDHIEVERLPLTACSVELLAYVIGELDPSMLDNMSADDSLRDWRIVFRSMFMRLADACDAEGVRS